MEHSGKQDSLNKLAGENAVNTSFQSVGNRVLVSSGDTSGQLRAVGWFWWFTKLFLAKQVNQKNKILTCMFNFSTWHDTKLRGVKMGRLLFFLPSPVDPNLTLTSWWQSLGKEWLLAFRGLWNNVHLHTYALTLCLCIISLPPHGTSAYLFRPFIPLMVSV